MRQRFLRGLLTFGLAVFLLGLTLEVTDTVSARRAARQYEDELATWRSLTPMDTEDSARFRIRVHWSTMRLDVQRERLAVRWTPASPYLRIAGAGVLLMLLGGSGLRRLGADGPPADVPAPDTPAPRSLLPQFAPGVVEEHRFAAGCAVLLAAPFTIATLGSLLFWPEAWPFTLLLAGLVGLLAAGAHHLSRGRRRGETELLAACALGLACGAVVWLRTGIASRFVLAVLVFGSLLALTLLPRRSPRRGAGENPGASPPNAP